MVPSRSVTAASRAGHSFERSIFGFAVIDRRVIAQGGPVERCGDAACAQIGFGRGAGNRAAGMKETARGFRRSAGAGGARLLCGGRTRQGEKGTRLVDGLAEAVQIAVAGDQIEQIAMLAGGGIGPFAGGAGTVIGTLQPDIEAAARRVLDIADDPVAARAASFGEVVTAHGLGIAREAARQIGGCADHGSSRDQAAARALARSSGWRSRSAARIAGPRSSAVGTKSRRRQAMISEVRPSAFNCGTAPSE